LPDGDRTEKKGVLLVLRGRKDRKCKGLGADAQEEAVRERADSEVGASTSSPDEPIFPERRKGKRPTRVEKGSWLGQHALIDEVTPLCPPLPLTGPIPEIRCGVEAKTLPLFLWNPLALHVSWIQHNLQNPLLN